MLIYLQDKKQGGEADGRGYCSYGGVLINKDDVKRGEADGRGYRSNC